MRNLKKVALATTVIAGSFLAVSSVQADAPTGLSAINHIVVIYEENHSFDNLYGHWGDVNGQHVIGTADATSAQTTQIAQTGTPYDCLLVTDPNMATPPQSDTCDDTAHQAVQPPASGVASTVRSHFPNSPFAIDQYVPASAMSCGPLSPAGSAPVLAPSGVAGGCTQDLVHRFYQEQYQLDGGKQDRYSQGSDATGLTQGYYDTTQLPIYTYLHGAGAPNYVIGDNFFQGAFGGSFLNHQVLISSQAPQWPGGADKSGVQTGCATGVANCDVHSVVDANGMPNSYAYYTPVATPGTAAPGHPGAPVVKDNQLTEAAGAGGTCAPSYATSATTPAGTLCGDYAINTIQPLTQPYAPGTVLGKRLPLLPDDTNSAYDNIGDEMNAANVSWAWYSGGWDNAAGNNGHDATHPLGAGWTNGPTATSAGACTAPAGTFVAANATFPYCPDALFQFHHQPFGYYANYADGTTGRVTHLQDEAQFKLDVANAPGTTVGGFTAKALPAVSFVKPIGEENEHPGYASEANGSQALVDLLKTIANGPYANDTLVVVTYDEFGGQWDHVAPPGQGNTGVHDAFGPGTRIPALFISKALPASGVSNTSYDTTSILRTIEKRFNVNPVKSENGGNARDAFVNDFGGVFDTSPPTDVPETSYSVLLPISTILVLVVLVAAPATIRRRRRSAA